MLKRHKTPDDRKRETDVLRRKLVSELGLPEQSIAPVIFELDRFDETGESYSGEFRMRDIGYKIVMKLSRLPHVQSEIVVRKI
jgi:hypothetical protein